MPYLNSHLEDKIGIILHVQVGKHYCQLKACLSVFSCFYDKMLYKNNLKDKQLLWIKITDCISPLWGIQDTGIWSS